MLGDLHTDEGLNMTSSSIEFSNFEPSVISNEHLNPVAARMMLAAFPPHITAGKSLVSWMESPSVLPSLLTNLFD
jgi:hypothetical protein